MFSVKTIATAALVLVVLVALLLFSIGSDHHNNSGSSDTHHQHQHQPHSSNSRQQRHGENPNNNNNHYARPNDYRNIIFSCFYFRSDFYRDRAVPSLDWMLVMIESAFEHRRCKSCQQQESRIVMFVDPETKRRLEDQILERHKKLGRPNFLLHHPSSSPVGGDDDDARHDDASRKSPSSSFLQLVPIYEDAERDPEVHTLFTSPESLWANSKKIKNAANNFRFWLIRRYLRSMLTSAVDASGDDLTADTPSNNHRSRLSQIRIAICDATDVLFQRNPFEEGTCFPQTQLASSSSADHQQQQHQQQQKRQFAPSMFLFTLEDSSKNFHNERYNKNWMKCYARDNNFDVSSSPSPLSDMDRSRMRISCAGVSFGSFFGVLTYVNAQLIEISKPPLVKCAMEEVKAALDQATHNYLLYRGIFESSSSSTKRSSSPWIKVLENPSANGGIRDVTVAAVPELARRQKQKQHQPQRVDSSSSSSSPLPPWTHYSDFLTAYDERNALVTKRSPSPSSTLTWTGSSDCVFHGNFGKLRMNAAGREVIAGVRRKKTRKKKKSDEEEAVVDNSNNREDDSDGDGDVVFAVVHQYTSGRHPRVMSAAKRRYKT